MPYIPRLYLDTNLSLNAIIALDKEQSHYLLRVLRASLNDTIHVFDGLKEASARLIDAEHNIISIKIDKIFRHKPHDTEFKLTMVFAPTKGLGAPYIVQKATELGVDEIIPILTKHTMVKSVNEQKLAKIAIEAAEQSGRLDVPAIHSMTPLLELLRQWQAIDTPPQIMFCYERAEASTITLKPHNTVILIGPEGGWSEQEYKAIITLPNVVVASISRNILKAETAAVCAVSLASYLLQYKV